MHCRIWRTKFRLPAERAAAERSSDSRGVRECPAPACCAVVRHMACIATTVLSCFFGAKPFCTAPGSPPTPLIMHCQNCTCRATSRHAEIGFSADLMLPAQVAAAWCARNFLKDPGHAEQQHAAQELGYWCCLHSLWLLSNCFFSATCTLQGRWIPAGHVRECLKNVACISCLQPAHFTGPDFCHICLSLNLQRCT